MRTLRNEPISLLVTWTVTDRTEGPGRLEAFLCRRFREPEKRWDNIGARIGRELRVVWGQQKLLQWPFPGIMHAFIFWGFVILFTTIVEAFGSVYVSGFALPI